MRILFSPPNLACALCLMLSAGCNEDRAPTGEGVTPANKQEAEAVDLSDGNAAEISKITDNPSDLLGDPDSERELQDESSESGSLESDQDSLGDTAVRGPVLVKAFVDSEKSDGEELEIVVSLETEFGWHTYARVGDEGTFQVTTVEIEDPEALQFVHELDRPRGTPYRKQPGTLIYRGRTEFRARIKKPEAQTQLTFRVGFQACSDEACWPPESVSLAVELGGAAK